MCNMNAISRVTYVICYTCYRISCFCLIISYRELGVALATHLATPVTGVCSSAFHCFHRVAYERVCFVADVSHIAPATLGLCQ